MKTAIWSSVLALVLLATPAWAVNVINSQETTDGDFFTVTNVGTLDVALADEVMIDVTSLGCAATVIITKMMFCSGEETETFTFEWDEASDEILWVIKNPGANTISSPCTTFESTLGVAKGMGIVPFTTAFTDLFLTTTGTPAANTWTFFYAEGICK